jgi:hypothetical protein
MHSSKGLWHRRRQLPRHLDCKETVSGGVEQQLQQLQRFLCWHYAAFRSLPPAVGLYCSIGLVHATCGGFFKGLPTWRPLLPSFLLNECMMAVLCGTWHRGAFLSVLRHTFVLLLSNSTIPFHW